MVRYWVPIEKRVDSEETMERKWELPSYFYNIPGIKCRDVCERHKRATAIIAEGEATAADD